MHGSEIVDIYRNIPPEIILFYQRDFFDVGNIVLIENRQNTFFVLQLRNLSEQIMIHFLFVDSEKDDYASQSGSYLHHSSPNHSCGIPSLSSRPLVDRMILSRIRSFFVSSSFSRQDMQRILRISARYLSPTWSRLISWNLHFS